MVTKRAKIKKTNEHKSAKNTSDEIDTLYIAQS
jgi:hypothetical protein